jgi:hypothetical protein
MNEALVGVYCILPSISAWNNIHLVSEIMSDDRFGGGGGNDVSNPAYDHFESDGTSNMMDDAWTKYYQGIFRANMIIKNIDNVEWESEDARGEILGQACFLRAYMYFDMAKIWGNVPLVTDPAAEANVPKATTDELFAQIATDLKTAIEVMPSVSFNAIPVSDLGRVNKWAAQGIMARAFLYYTGISGNPSMPLVVVEGESGATEVTQSEVVAWLDDCIGNSGYGLVGDFRNLWPYALVTAENSPVQQYPFAVDNNLSWIGEDGANNESMFMLKFGTTASWGTSIYYSNQINLFFGSRGQDYDAMFPFGQGWGMGPVSPDLWANWPDDDLRKRGSICNSQDPNEVAAEGIGTYDMNGDKNTYETGIWSKKYIPINVETADGRHNYSVDLYGCTANYQLDNTQDIVLLRFADVLLMHSELTQTVTGINLVRARAQLDPLAAYDEEALRAERRYELAFEGIRYYDLQRYGHDYAKAALLRQEGLPIYNSGVPGLTEYDGFARYDVTHGYFQIPKSEIELSEGVLVQNDGF